MDILIFAVRAFVLFLFFAMGLAHMHSKTIVTRETPPQLVMVIVGNNIAGAIIVAACVVALFI